MNYARHDYKNGWMYNLLLKKLNLQWFLVFKVCSVLWDFSSRFLNPNPLSKNLLAASEGERHSKLFSSFDVMLSFSACALSVLIEEVDLTSFGNIGGTP